MSQATLYTMTLWIVLSLLAWFPLQEASLTTHTETLIVEEGQMLTLKCVISQAKESSLQWVSPSGFTIFFDKHPVTSGQSITFCPEIAANQKCTLAQILGLGCKSQKGYLLALCQNAEILSLNLRNCSVLMAKQLLMDKTMEVLKNQKYQLLNHSNDQLTISISNVTLHDEGVYKCLHYSKPVRTKEVNVIILATPSKPTVEASTIRTPNGREVLLKCFTKGSKPPPQITWLLSNGIELYGETQHTFEYNGKKCNTTSTLRVHAYGENATANCLVRHEGLRGEKLVVPFRFEDLDPDSDSDRMEHSTLPFQSSQYSTEFVMEEFSSVDIGTTGHEQTSHKYNSISEENPTSVEITKKKHGILLLTLVSFLILFLFIVVQLFIMKLWKAHVIWKKENDISEMTLESYKSRSNNDDTASQEKNDQIFGHKCGMKYIITSYMERKSKNPKENIQNATLKQEPNHLPETIV